MPSTPNNPGTKTHGFDAEYRALCRRFPPRAITSERKMKNTQALINALIDKPSRLSRAEREYLNTVATLLRGLPAAFLPDAGAAGAKVA